MKIIAEIGCNHMGNIKIAKEMIDILAVFCKADVVKFQKRSPKELLTEEQYNSPHPNPHNSYGSTYGEHREFLELDIVQHKELKSYAEEKGLIYSCSVWDLTSAQEIISLNPQFIKVPSASNTNYKMLNYLCETFPGEIHISFGMTEIEEEKEIINTFEKYKREKDLVIYSCTSGYPVTFEDICLYEIIRLKESYGDRVKAVGFSGHHLGIAADIGALTLGSEYFERHFTLDRTWKGTDHAASLEPEGMRKLARDLRNVTKALCYKNKELLDVEIEQRRKLKYNEK